MSDFQMRIAIVLAAMLVACGHRRPVSHAPDASAAEPGASVPAPAATLFPPQHGPVFGAMREHYQFGAGTGLSVAQTPNADGTLLTTYTNTATSGVSSVTGTGTVSCSPTTGAVSCSGPSVTGTGFWWANAGALDSASVILGGDLSQFPLSGSQVDEEVVGVLHKALPALPATDQYLHFTGTGAGNAWAFSAVTSGVSSVTGAGSTSCSPTTGAVTCTTSNTVGNGLTGQTALANHSVLLGAGTSAINAVGPSASTGFPLVSTGSGSDPAFQQLGLAALAGSSTNGNVATSNGSNWVSAAPLITQGQFATGSVTALNNTTKITIATVTFTTPNDGISHKWLVHQDYFFENTNSGGVLDQAECGAGIDSSSTITGPFLQQTLVPGSGNTLGFQADNASNTITATLTPNASHTLNALCFLISGSGSSGANDQVAASISAQVIQ